MFNAKLVSAVCVSMALVACTTAQMPSRGSEMASTGVGDVGTSATVQTQYHVVGYSVTVPRELLVSEADVYLPNADIVWHGDPEGDRFAQIEAMFNTALARSTADMTAGRPVEIQIQVAKFHALSPKTRATIGGNYGMDFYLTVYDATTHEILDGPRMVVADTPASGGIRALREEQSGITQKIVVVSHLTKVFDAELARPGNAPAAAQDVTRDDFSPADLTLAE